jgi:hypothetical protein
MQHCHLGAARHVIKRHAPKLHVIAVVFNPLRFQSRYNLFRDFSQHVCRNNEAEMWVAELALGSRPFEVTDACNPKHMQFRTNHELWHKERLINMAVSRLPSDWEYVAWIDADVTFLNPDWAHEAIQQLQHYQVVQLFTHAMDVGPSGEPIEQFEGFASSHIQRKPFPKLNGVGEKKSYYGKGKYWHPGYGWAYRRSAWDTLGGLLDINVVGGGDHQMAYGLIGRVDETIPNGSAHHYSRSVKTWARNASLLRRDIGAVPGTVVHHYHGPKKARGYHNRWRILTDNKFDPLTDLKNDWQGALALSGNKIQLRDDLRAYFRQRNEDAI